VARDHNDQTLREHVRRNVGRSPSYTPYPPGPPVPGRYGLLFQGGDLIGGEDVGVHAHLSAGNLVVEPWRKVLATGQRLKLKVHNVAGGIRVVAVYADLDDLTTL
jgi:hypothetical protein